MKREIYCRKCMTRVQVILDKEQLPPGEHIKYIVGTLKKTVTPCDFCNKPIYQNEKCCAFSNWVEGVSPYTIWEFQYLNLDADPKPLPVKILGIYPLLATGDDAQLTEFVIQTSVVLNFLERRLNTVFAMCMAESLEFATSIGGRLNLTIQYVDHDTEGNETYPVINKGSHALWEKGGYSEV